MKRTIIRGAFLLALVVSLLAGCAGKQTPGASGDVPEEPDGLQTTVQDTETIREDGARVESSVSTTQCEDGSRIISTQTQVTYPNGDTEQIRKDETWQADGSGKMEETGLRRQTDGGTVQMTIRTDVYADGMRIIRKSVLTTAADGTGEGEETITTVDRTGKEDTETACYQIDAQGNRLPRD